MSSGENKMTELDFMDRFSECLTLVAKAASELKRLHGSEVVLVGGAAVVVYTNGLFHSGDFDLITAADESFLRILLETGFHEDTGPGKLKNRYYHPDQPGFSVQLVSGPLFDGRTDRLRLATVEVTAGAGLRLPPVEDLIADRLAQYAAGPTDPSRLEQARALFSLAKDIDHDYLAKRIVEEGGEITLLDDDGDEQPILHSY
jgi:hypothetical protein